MATLFDALLAVARAVEALQESTADSGTASTLTDAKIAARGFKGGYFTGGTLFMIEASGSPIENTTRYISNSTTSGVFTFTPAFTSACPAAGDWYGVMTDLYPKQVIIGKINETLRDYGDATAEDTSMTAAADTYDYNLPSAAARDLRQVWTGTSPTWDMHTRWEVTAGSAGTVLRFLDEPDAGDTIKLIYLAKHSTVKNDTDTVNAEIDVLALDTAARIVRWRLEQPGADEKRLTALLNDLMARGALQKKARPKNYPKRTPIFPSG